MLTGILTIVGLIISLIVGAAIKSMIGSLLFYGAIGLAVFFAVKQIDKLKQPLLDLVVVLIGGFAFANATAIRNHISPPQPDRGASQHRRLLKDVAFSDNTGAVSPAGTEVTCDLPESMRLHNTVGTNRLGLCVFTSITHDALYQNESRLFNFQHDMMSEPGGGDPKKVDAMIAKYGKGAEYLQYLGNDPAFLREVLATGRMVAVSYNGRDPRYKQTIAHMVNLVHLDDKEACILDNNFEKKYYWMSRDEFLDRWRMLDRYGRDTGRCWAVVLLAPPPPGPPRNALDAKLFEFALPALDFDFNTPLFEVPLK